jgi:hypothetical protein
MHLSFSHKVKSHAPLRTKKNQNGQTQNQNYATKWNVKFEKLQTKVVNKSCKHIGFKKGWSLFHSFVTFWFEDLGMAYISQVFFTLDSKHWHNSKLCFATWQFPFQKKSSRVKTTAGCKIVCTNPSVCLISSTIGSSWN